MTQQDFPADIVMHGTVLAVCDATKILNPILKAGRDSDKLYIIAPTLEKMLYRNKQDKVSYARKTNLKNYYLNLNEVQMTLEDPFHLALVAPDDIFEYQHPSFKQFRNDFENTVDWKFYLQEIAPQLNGLMNYSYYSGSRLFSLAINNSGETNLTDSNYSQFPSLVFNVLRIKMLADGRSDWFWNKDLINMATLFYLSGTKSNASFMKLISETVTLLPEGRMSKSVSDSKTCVSKFLHKLLLQEKELV